MSPRAATSRLRRLGGRSLRLLPQPLVHRVARLVRRHSLTVVVVVDDDNATFLDDCVSSLHRQPRRPDEVVLVSPATGKDARALVDRQAAASWRVRVVDPTGAPAASAADHGVLAATGDRVMVLDAGDQLADGALAALALQLDTTGASVAGATRADLGHAELADLMFVRSLWAGARVDVPDGPFADWSTAARLVLAAGEAAPAVGAVRVGVRRGTGVAFGSMPVLAPWVDAWSTALEGLVGALRGDPALGPVLRWALEDETARFLEDAERCSPAQWTTLTGLVGRLLEVAPSELMADLRVESRVRLLLAAAGHRGELERFNVARWLEEGQFPTRLVEAGVEAELPVDLALLPPDALLLGPSELRLVVELRRLRPVTEPSEAEGPAEAVEVELLVYVSRVPAVAVPRSLVMEWVSSDGVRTPLMIAGHPDPEANVVAADRFIDRSTAVFRGRVALHELLSASPNGARWHLEVELDVAGITRRGVVSQVDLRGSAGAFDALSRHGFTFRAACTTDGCELLAVPGEREPIRDETWSVSDVRLDDGCLVVRGRAPRGDVDQASLRVSGPVETTPVRLDVVVGAFEARLALVHDPWGAGETPLPPGGYRLWVHVPGRDPVGLRIAPDLATRTPLRQRSDTYRLRVQRALDGGVLLSLAAPLRDDEVGAFNQQGLQRWYASDDHRLDPESVYLQSYTGQSATDSPLAVHHALRRLHPGLTLYWGVSDRSTRVPEGAHPVLIRSREWYAAIATCGSIVTNVDMDRWFRKRPGQRLLQSFHGYPSKIMGISAWQAKNFTPLRVARQLARTSSTWDLLLTPTPAMDAHYRREYRYDGEILAAGYPRDDVLVGPDAEGIRAQTRRRLGIAPGVHVVLHAPTWRDDLATNFRRAAPTGVFDAERAAAELGEGYVILLRGHRFHRQRTDLPAERLIDVTDYPEVNDLILASDAAVFDYTSMRFDFALTGRPMMFLVPDLDRYTEGVRGFLFDFRRSAPGPLVEDTAAVVAALRDLDGLSARYGDELARFNQEFNDRQDGQAAERVVRAFFGDPVSERAGSSPEAPV